MIPKPVKPLGAPVLPVFEVEPEVVGGFTVVSNENSNTTNGWVTKQFSNSEPGFQLKASTREAETQREVPSWGEESSTFKLSQVSQIDSESFKRPLETISTKVEAWPFPDGKKSSKAVLELPVVHPKLSSTPKLEISKSKTVELPPPLTPVKSSEGFRPVPPWVDPEEISNDRKDIKLKASSEPPKNIESNNRVGIIPEPRCNGSLIISFESSDTDGGPYISLLGIETGVGKTYRQLKDEIFSKVVRHFQANEIDIETLFNEGEEVQFLQREKGKLGDLSDLVYEVIDTDSGEWVGHYRISVIGGVNGSWEGVTENILEDDS